MSSRRPSSFSKSSNSSSSLSSPTTSPISRVPRTNSNGTPRRVTLVEPEKPTKHEQLSEEPCKSKRKKALKVVVDGVSIVAHLLCMCCVLSGEQRPKNGAYYAHYDEDECRGARKVQQSRGNTHPNMKQRVSVR
ncbi:Protein of unknown function [Pyronema omphalodes CBS 100304]|uniref:Uncharacterized protein n=1 Tax=Pyronema omphalodes (strain CBS 100304) TaxID=1076935 RepID=U4LAY5_PYROM|nr:Protein of unknown function [Pyronema omphalodes CBS 100304]